MAACASCPEAHEQIALPVERHRRAVFEHQRDGRRVRDAKRHRAGAGRGGDGRERQTGIDLPVVLEHQRDAPEDAVGVGRGVQEPRRTSRPSQNRKVAHRACRAEVGDAVEVVLRLHDGQAERVEAAVGRRARTAVERQAAPSTTPPSATVAASTRRA
jgi:hypothetical protein